MPAAATLLRLTLMTTAAGPSFLYLVPVRDASPIDPGPDGLRRRLRRSARQPFVMDPVSGGFDVPVFAINGDGELSFCGPCRTKVPRSAA